MKFLECSALDRLNDFLGNLNLGERTIKGCLEAYSCKHAGSDKKLSISLETEILDYLGKSSDTDSSSPDQTLLTRNSRKTLVYLVLTLYHMYPDYDFSAVKAHQFFAEESWDSFKQIFDTYMNEASKVKEVLSNGGAMVVLRGGNLKKRHRIAVAGLQWRCHGGRHSHGGVGLTRPNPTRYFIQKRSGETQHRTQHATRSETPHPAATPHTAATVHPAAMTPRPARATSTGTRPRDGDEHRFPVVSFLTTVLVDLSMQEWAETVGSASLLDTLFKALDEVVKLVDSEIYGYVPDFEANPLLESGAIWSFNFLFYNRKLKRIVSFRFSCFSNLIAEGLLIDDIHNEYDEEIFADMDI
ncbi:Repressor of RNA polymerase III transcription MAF1 [Glycine soja]